MIIIDASAIDASTSRSLSCRTKEGSGILDFSRPDSTMPTRRELLAATTIVPASLLGASLKGQEEKKAVPSSKKEPIRYLQIGVGHDHAYKIDAYKESPDWEIVGVVEEDPVWKESAMKSKRYSSLPFLSLEEGLKIPGLQVVGIETEMQHLLRYGQIAVEAGYHIHLDKPAGFVMEDYRRLMKVADEKQRIVQMGYMYRCNPTVLLLQQILKAGWLGEIFEVHSVMSKVIPDDFRKKLDVYPGGMMMYLGCHLIDLTLMTLGRPDRIHSFPRKSAVGKQDKLIDNMLAVFEYQRATATVRSSAEEVEGFARRHFTACGTGGTYHIQPLDTPSVTLSLDQERRADWEGWEGKVFPKGITHIPFEPPYRRYVGDAADLAKMVRGEMENPYPSSYDLMVQETTLIAAGVMAAEG